MSSLELIKVDQEKKTVDARELHAFLGAATQFSVWAKRRIEEYGFVSGQDYWVLKNDVNEFKDFQLSIDMAKELCMVERTEKGRQARKYFIEVENKWRSSTPKSGAKALLESVKLLVEHEERLSAIEAKQQEQDGKMLLLSSDTEYRSIMAFARLKGWKISRDEAAKVGKKAAAISKDRGIHVGVVPDERYGKVNSYHVSILTPVMEAWNAGVL